MLEGEEVVLHRTCICFYSYSKRRTLELISKEDLDSALRAHKAAVDATKSPQREEAGKLYEVLESVV